MPGENNTKLSNNDSFVSLKGIGVVEGREVGGDMKWRDTEVRFKSCI